MQWSVLQTFIRCEKGHSGNYESRIAVQSHLTAAWLSKAQTWKDDMEIRTADWKTTAFSRSYRWRDSACERCILEERWTLGSVGKYPRKLEGKWTVKNSWWVAVKRMDFSVLRNLISRYVSSGSINASMFALHSSNIICNWHSVTYLLQCNNVDLLKQGRGFCMLFFPVVWVGGLLMFDDKHVIDQRVVTPKRQSIYELSPGSGNHNMSSGSRFRAECRMCQKGPDGCIGRVCGIGIQINLAGPFIVLLKNKLYRFLFVHSQRPATTHLI